MNLADSTLIFDPISTQISNPISIAELEAQITELAGNLNAANHRWLMLIAEFDRRDGWGDGATQSADPLDRCRPERGGQDNERPKSTGLTPDPAGFVS